MTDSSGKNVSSDEIGGVEHQQVKLEFGNKGSAFLVSEDYPLPVTLGSKLHILNFQGDVPHSGEDHGFPIKIGYFAVSHGSSPTSVKVGDRTNGYSNIDGIPFMIAGHPNIVTREVEIDDEVVNYEIVSPNENKIIVTECQLLSSSNCGKNISFRMGFGVSVMPVSDGILLSHPGFISGLSVTRGNGSGIIGMGKLNEKLLLTCSNPSPGKVRVLVSYYLINA
jgi:hypothetical protein